MKIKVEYDGAWPNLCSGNLKVIIDGVDWVFPSYCLSSGGSCDFTENWDSYVNHGPWSVREWPNNFPEELQNEVLEAINDQIPHGCCGGCL